MIHGSYEVLPLGALASEKGIRFTPICLCYNANEIKPKCAKGSAQMSQVTLAIPSSVTEEEARFYLAMKLFEVGRLSCGQAAALAGYSKRTLIELLGKQGVAVVNYPIQELPDDLLHV